MEFNSIHLISRIREAANKLIERELHAAGIKGLVPSHGDIISVLFMAERVTMQEIALKINRTKATVTVLADKLVELKLAAREKSSTDSRVTYLKLTKAGLALKPVFKKISKKLNAKVYSGLSDTECERLEKLLGRVRDNFKN